MQNRYHSPHRLSIGFIVSKNESPNENRFLNINKSPVVLSKYERVKSPNLSGYSERKDTQFRPPNCVKICYDQNYDVVRPNPTKPVVDFMRATARKDNILSGSGF